MQEEMQAEDLSGSVQGAPAPVAADGAVPRPAAAPADGPGPAGRGAVQMPQAVPAGHGAVPCAEAVEPAAPQDAPQDAPGRARALAAALCRKAVPRYLRDPGLRRRVRYAGCHRRCSIDAGMVLYESFHGRGMVCNPYAVFKEILSRPECARMRHVWALDDPAEIAAAKEEYGTHANVSFVRYRSRAYLKALCTAGYLVNNVMWDPCFAKREGQAYLNTWHGTALKALGFSTPNGRFNQYNQLKDFLAADYIISGNAHMTEVLRASYKLDGLFPGTLLESGSPRNDALAAPCGRDEALARLARRGVRVDAGKRVVLYAPTWRGRYTDAGPDPAAGDYLAFAAALGKAVGEGCQVLVRPHHVVCRRLEDQGGLPAPFVPAAVDAAEALAAADVLVTDYSSIFFDFLATGRPVLFYTPDLGEYCAERGLCLPLDALPGPRSADVADIAAWVRDTGPVEAAFKQEYEAARRWATGNDDGAAAARAADALLHGRTEGTGAVGGLDAGRERLLVLAGDMRPGPVAESVSALLGSTGYDTADVSVYVRPSQDGACRENVGGIDPRARVLYRSSGYCATPAEALRHRLFGRRSRPGGPSARLAPAAFYRREAARSFGGCGFDRVIDLAGGGGLLAALLPHLPAPHGGPACTGEAAGCVPGAAPQAAEAHREAAAS